jgi:predicted AlkP superfamily pyrophosphatase or phosphodiesterase
MTRRAFVCFSLFTFLFTITAPAPHAAPVGRPKLIVVLAVDQFRADFVDRFQHQWTRGLRRLVERGAWFRQAAYSYLSTVTCAGHATISTGSVPSTHGMILNAWWDRESQRQVNCTEDPSSPLVSYSTPVPGGGGPPPLNKVGESPYRLISSTLADELRMQLGDSRVVSFSMKARSAIMLAGRRGNAITWFEGSQWVTSTAYTDRPVAAVQEFIAANPVERDLGKSWTRSLPASEYIYTDEAIGERPPKGWTGTFPHVAAGAAGAADAQYYDLWQSTPLADEYLAKIALATARAFELGRRPGATDFLGISFSTLDRVGHAFGPHSHEIQDVLVRLDATIGAMLDELDKTIGRDRYVVALSSDHGVSPIPERVAAEGLDAGRITAKDATARVEAALAPLLGAGKHVASMQYTDFYFMPGVYEKLQANPAAMKAAIDALRGTPGIWRVYRSDALFQPPATEDVVTRAAIASYFPGRSGDLILVPRPYWILSTAAATHGTAHAYDTRVPVILAGSGIRPGEYLTPASPADIAPTLAFLAGVLLPRPDGRALTEALATSPTTIKPRPAPTNGRPAPTRP